MKFYFHFSFYKEAYHCNLKIILPSRRSEYSNSEIDNPLLFKIILVEITNKLGHNSNRITEKHTQISTNSYTDTEL